VRRHTLHPQTRCSCTTRLIDINIQSQSTHGQDYYCTQQGKAPSREHRLSTRVTAAEPFNINLNHQAAPSMLGRLIAQTNSRAMAEMCRPKGWRAQTYQRPHDLKACCHARQSERGRFSGSTRCRHTILRHTAAIIIWTGPLVGSMA
jgi:hypothetical protein